MTRHYFYFRFRAEKVTKLNVNDFYTTRVFSTEFRDFVDICLRKNPGERPDLVTLMSHPWLLDVEKDPTDVAKWVRDVIKLPNPQ